eukprot:scaffold23938_cov31-Tisochrysis_lutea.AAC.1
MEEGAPAAQQKLRSTAVGQCPREFGVQRHHAASRPHCLACWDDRCRRVASWIVAVGRGAAFCTYST